MSTFTPAQWCLIDLASQYGMDKKPFEERLTFGRELLEDIKENKDMSSWITSADSPECFALRILTIQDILEGKPCGHPLGLDAASSGPQILSVLCRCVRGMSKTGVLGSEVPDLYTTIYHAMETEKERSRSQVKKACVPYVYGSTSAPEKVFGDDAEMFEHAYSVAVPAAASVREILLNAWNPSATHHTWVLPDGHVAHVPVTESITYEGAQMGTKNYNFIETRLITKSKGMSLPANVTHSFDSYIARELSERANYDEEHLRSVKAAIADHKANGSEYSNEQLLTLQTLSAKFKMVSIEGTVHVFRNGLKDIEDWYIDALSDLVDACLARPSFQVRMIHDEFQCLPNHVNNMKQIYNDILVEGYDGDWLFTVIQTLTGRNFRMLRPEPDEAIRQQIRHNRYAIH